MALSRGTRIRAYYEEAPYGKVIGMTQTGTTYDASTAIGQAMALIDAARGTDYLPPSRTEKPGDVRLGSATEHIRAVRTAKQRLEDEIRPAADKLRILSNEIVEMAPREARKTQGALNAFIEGNPEAKAKFDEGQRLNMTVQGKYATLRLMKLILHAEVRTAFPESADRLDQKVPRINQNWDVVAADVHHRSHGPLVLMMSGADLMGMTRQEAGHA